MKKYERMAGVFLVLVGLATGVHSWLNLKLGTMQMPDSGFMPFVASMVLVVCSALLVLSSLGKDEKPEPFWEGRGWLKPALAVFMMLFYAWSMDMLGYLFSTLVFMLVWQFVIEREKWLKASIVSVAATVVMWILFSKLLGVPLPTGILTI